jgi:hypothetical protein
MVTVTRPQWFMIGGLVFGSVMTLLQRLTAPALGFAENSDGFNTVLLIWWLIGGLLFMVGLVLTVVVGAGNHPGDARRGPNEGQARDRHWPV